MAFPSKQQHQREKQTAGSKQTDEINRNIAQLIDKLET